MCFVYVKIAYNSYAQLLLTAALVNSALIARAHDFIPAVCDAQLSF